MKIVEFKGFEIVIYGFGIFRRDVPFFFFFSDDIPTTVVTQAVPQRTNFISSSFHFISLHLPIS